MLRLFCWSAFAAVSVTGSCCCLLAAGDGAGGAGGGGGFFDVDDHLHTFAYHYQPLFPSINPH